MAGLNPLDVVKALGEGLRTIRDNVPQLEDEVTVEVSGQPGSNKQYLYFLALATASGMVSRMGASLTAAAGSVGMVMIEYDAAGDWVRATLRYKWGMARLAVQAPVDTGPAGPVGGSGSLAGGIPKRYGVGGRGTGRFDFNDLVVYRGPSCDVVGGAFNFTNDVLPGIPLSSSSFDAPQLPFAGSMILNPCPKGTLPNPAPVTQNPVPTANLSRPGANDLSPNPKPPGDNRSRGAVYVPTEGNLAAAGVAAVGGNIGACCPKLLALVPLVAAALSAPATNSLMTFEPPNTGATGV